MDAAVNVRAIVRSNILTVREEILKWPTLRSKPSDHVKNPDGFSSQRRSPVGDITGHRGCGGAWVLPSDHPSMNG